MSRRHELVSDLWSLVTTVHDQSPSAVSRPGVGNLAKLQISDLVLIEVTMTVITVTVIEQNLLHWNCGKEFSSRLENGRCKDRKVGRALWREKKIVVQILVI